MRASKTAQYVALHRALDTVEPRRAPHFQEPLVTCFLTPLLAAAVDASPFASRRTVLAWSAAPGSSRIDGDASYRLAVARLASGQ